MLDTGESHLHTVVCLHSLFLGNRMFDGLVEQGRGRLRFVRPEFPGQGSRLAEASGPVTMDACSDDVLRILDRLDLSRVSLVGASMGGDVAFRIAARRPDLVQRMVVMGTSARAESAENIANFGVLDEQVARHGFSAEIVDAVMGILFARSVLSDPLREDVHQHWRGFLRELSPEITHAGRGVLERESVLDLLPSIQAPTLVISGIEDLARPQAWSDEIFERIPDAELWRIKKAGHSPILERPEQVIPRVLGFLGSTATSSSELPPSVIV